MGMMDSDRLELVVQGQAPTVIIALRGELTSPESGAVLAAYRRVTSDGARSIIVDFSQVALMNSSGISQLIAMITEANKAGQRVFFTGLTNHYRKILTMMGLTRYAKVYDTLADAQQALQAAQ
jgi:anti-anti-sigma factor